MVELIIEGISIDLDEQTSIELTININDIRNPITTNNSWSKSIDVPGTNNNNKAFNFINDNNIEVGYNPNLKRQAEIRIDGIPIITGYVKINDINVINGVTNYSIIVYGNNTTLFEDMGDSLITELNLSTYDHKYTYENIKNTWETADRDGFYYPFTNYNDLKMNYSDIISGISSYQFFPGFYIKTILDRMFLENGYSYDSNFFNSDFFKTLYLPYTSSGSLGEVEVFSSTERSRQYINVGDIPPYVYNLRTFISKTDPLNKYVYNSGIEMYNHYTEKQGIWNINISGTSLGAPDGDYTFSSLDIKVYTRMPKSSNPSRWYLAKSTTFNNTGSTTERCNFSIDIETPEIQKDRDLFVVVTPWGDYLDGIDFDSIVNFNLTFKIKTSKMYIGLTDVKTEYTLPKIKQKDLFQTLNLMFNLYVERDPNDYNKLVIEPYNDYYLRSNTKDWTYKVDERSREYKLMSEITSKSYTFSYKKDTDVLNKLYFDNIGKSPGEITTYTKTSFISKEEKIELLPSSTIIESLYDDSGISIPSIYKEYTGDQPTGYEGNITTGWNWRILAQKVFSLSSPFTFDGDSINNFYTGSHIVSGQSLWFNDGDQDYCVDEEGLPNLYTLYWKDYIDMIRNQNSKLLTMDVFLNEYEISNLRFYDKIFIDDIWFYLNRIIYSPTSRKCKAELLLIPSTQIHNVFFDNFRVSDIDNIYTDQTFYAYIDIHNYSQEEQEYNGVFSVEDSTGDVITSISFTGTIPKNSTITIEKPLEVSVWGNYFVWCRDDVSYKEYISILIRVPFYDYSPLSSYSPKGNYTGFETQISFDIDAIDPEHIGCTNGILKNLTTNEEHSWEYCSNGLSSTTITKSFTLANGVNVFQSSGDYNSQSIGVYAIDPVAFLSHHSWVYIPSDPSEKTDMTVRWRINNTGQIPATNVSAVLETFWNVGRTVENYDPISFVGLTFPTGITNVDFVLTDLPDGNDADLQVPVTIYTTGELSPWFSNNSQFIVYPCDDDVYTTSYSIENNNITGNTTAVRVEYLLENGSCHATGLNTWTLSYSYFNGTALYDTYYFTMPNIPANDAVEIPYSFTSFTPPNNWTNGSTCKVVVEAIRDLDSEIFELFERQFTYWVGNPSVDWVDDSDTQLTSGSTWDSLQMNVKAKNNGGGTSSNTYCYYHYKNENGTTLTHRTGSTTTLTANETKYIPASAVGTTVGINQTYSCDWYLYSDGSLRDSGTDYFEIKDYAAVYFEHTGGGSNYGEITLSYWGHEDQNKTIDIKLGITGQTTATWESGVGTFIGSMSIEVYSGMTSKGSILSESEANQYNENDSDDKYTSIELTGIKLVGEMGDTGILMYWAGQCENNQSGFSTSEGRIEIYYVGITSGGGAVDGQGVDEWLYTDCN